MSYCSFFRILICNTKDTDGEPLGFHPVENDELKYGKYSEQKK